MSKGRWAVPGYKASERVVMDVIPCIANNPTGEVRRPLGALSVSLLFEIPRSGLYYLRVNGYQVSMQA